MEVLIQKWLDENGPFAAGVTLYLSTGQETYVRRLSKAAKKKWVEPDDMALLRRLLEQHINYQPKANPSYVPLSDLEEATPDPPQPVNEPEAIRALRAQAIPLHKRYSHLKAQLHTMVIDRDKYTAKERYDIAREIMQDVLPPTDELYDQIRAWEQDGTLPPDPEDNVVQQTVEKMQRVYSLRPRISRLKKWKDDPELDADKRREYTKELLDKELELAQLERELGL
ncbi:hypothetical protein [Flavilitoribacter nigricans]|uniref:Uncharacterized protein n=1 Tax=Flavilitoribacter nigricans (strain ATCC 23147 / DSM 23189 / NBRC 102662 / NCIMB 1420 / SS-2) TaxID=1122177 RepID=A0A2D0NEL8_FLAN2|nr:hypothetical protein [Flavilitoribacter nigricans]PHN06951.1 hypothetical protein CRP01_09045 [Flavilitoribacter nigricans DSM 23189 = NBRC 102662]